MQNFIDLLEPLRRLSAKLGPYILLELLLPGGTLFALLLFLHQRVKANAGNFATLQASPPVLVSTAYEAHLQCIRVVASSRMISAFV